MIYNKFLSFFYWDQWGECFYESMFSIFFHLIYNCSAFGYSKKFDICLLTGWSSTLFILLVNIFNHTFNLFINNIISKPIIDESLLYVIYLFIKYCFGGGDQFATGYQIINNFFFISEGAFTFKFEGTGVITRGVFINRCCEVTPLSRRFTMHLSDTSSIAQNLHRHSCPTTELRKILTDNTTLLEHQNNKQKLQILEALHIRNRQPTLNKINFKTSANVLKCL